MSSTKSHSGTTLNAPSSFDKVPNELLERIILFVQQITTDWDADYWHWVVLLNVSHGWRKLIVNAPELWRIIDLDWEDAEMYFKFSKATPLNLISIASRKFPDKFIEHSVRVQECFSVMAPGTAGVFYSFLKTGGVPILQELRMNSCGDKQTQPVFDAVIPSLRRLRTKNIPVDWSSPSLSGLTHLDISYFTEPSISDVLGMLETTNRLQHFVLRGTVPSCNGACDPKSTPFRRVSLPHISYLKLKGGWSTIIHFLAHLSIPTSASIEVASPSHPGSAKLAEGVHEVSLASEPKYKITFNWLRSDTVIEAKTVEGGIQYVRRFRCETSQDQPPMTLHIGPIFGRYNNVVSLYLIVGWNTIDKKMWAEALRGMNNVSTLRVGDSYKTGPFRELLLALAEGPENVLLHSLRTLILEGICSVLRGARKPSRRIPRSISAIVMPALLMRKSKGIGLKDLRVAACKLGDIGDVRAVKNLVEELRCKRVTCEACLEEDDFDYGDSDSDSDYFEFK